jgi:hypothetical protein
LLQQLHRHGKARAEKIFQRIEHLAVISTLSAGVKFEFILRVGEFNDNW